MEINKKLTNIIWVSLSIILLSNCSTVKVSKTPFGSTSNCTAVDLFTLENPNGMQAKITNYGGILTQLHVPDKNGKLGDVVSAMTSYPATLKQAHTLAV